MNSFRIIIMMFLLSYTAQAQSVEILSPPGDNTRTFQTSEGNLNLQGNSVQIQSENNLESVNGVLSLSLSPKENRIGLMANGKESVYKLFNSESVNLLEKEFEFIDPEDSSIKIYQFDNGSFIVRDNISNFNFFNAAGRNLFGIQNQSGSPLGETISELRSGASGSTILIYNPVIKFENSSGSRAKIVLPDGTTNTVYDSNDRVIENAIISHSGSFILLLTKKDGTDDRIILFDRFGSALYDMESSEELIGMSIDIESNYLTLFSSNRVQVYDVNSGDRIASSSFRSSIINAGYQAEDQQILVLSGSVRGGDINIISNVELHSIHTQKRQIARSKFSGNLSFISPERISFERSSQNSYRLTGLNRDLHLRTNF